jgi:hypothetical protein
MPLVGFEPMTPVFERAKTVHVLDCAAAVIGNAPFLLMIKTSTISRNKHITPTSI